MGKDVWDRNETRSRVWLAVKAAGEQGIFKGALDRAVALSGSAVDHHLKNLMRDHYVRRPDNADGHPVWGRYCAGDQVPPIDGYGLQCALELLDDCPGGVSVDLLCKELGLTARELTLLLEPIEREGNVQRMQIPLQHGGGMGWRLHGINADTEFINPLATPVVRVEDTRPQPAELLSLPVVEVDIDRVHRVRGSKFDCKIGSDGSLTIDTGVVQLTLQAHCARQLMHMLAPHVAAEGGLA
jgi:hypothetical protein